VVDDFGGFGVDEIDVFGESVIDEVEEVEGMEEVEGFDENEN
jgi:hypothetical protein